MRQVKGSKLVANVETLDALAGLLGVPGNSSRRSSTPVTGDGPTCQPFTLAVTTKDRR